MLPTRESKKNIKKNILGKYCQVSSVTILTFLTYTTCYIHVHISAKGLILAEAEIQNKSIAGAMLEK